MLRDYFRIVPEGDALQRREKVAGKIVILDRMLEDTLPYFYALLGVAESDRSITQMEWRSTTGLRKGLIRQT